MILESHHHEKYNILVSNKQKCLSMIIQYKKFLRFWKKALFLSKYSVLEGWMVYSSFLLSVFIKNVACVSDCENISE